MLACAGSISMLSFSYSVSAPGGREGPAAGRIIIYRVGDGRPRGTTRGRRRS